MNKLHFTLQQYDVFYAPEDNSAGKVKLRKEIHEKLIELDNELKKNNFISDLWIHGNSRFKTSEYVFTSRKKSIMFMSLRYWDKNFISSLNPRKKSYYYYPHIEIKVNQNGVFIGLYISDYNKENTSGIKQNWSDIDHKLNELAEQDYFWEYDNAKKHNFLWITDISHESILLKKIMDSSKSDNAINISVIRNEINVLYGLLKKLSL